ncbi:hypothetical protein RZQ20_25580 [Raoultella ornithinolytica]|uniref:hypothetical protein n=1 Tax=Raoultella ornithinolytica TaxID=54291 RepID=UPI00255ADC04|nr:hypothetical protein [Raoultella ornithinolytica]MDL4585339.1 hypothetical protein [Raoultella ornithinolytica]MDV1095637.1 hypothetical protein [Raoultella ornithinolytica]MDV1123188.1 hypothetical protein [Raoultella ornithinolytica]MDV1893548.1 hypothetical protein [Raoultella ornithinolytica]HEC2564903.1 hypothetical protein [Raoultella ornithinolytica]
MNKSFLMRTAFVLFLLAVVCCVAGIVAWKFWHLMFESLKYGSTDYTQLNAENQAMKTPLNLMMYCMPVGFGCAAVGLLVSAILAYVLGAMEAVVAHVSRRLNLKGGSHE